MNPLPALAFGVVLSACAGLRAFLPVFSASLAVQVFHMQVPDHLAWLHHPETLILFGVATFVELLGDKLPVVDHLLDSVQVFTKPALAALAATPFLYQLSPEYAVGIAIILGAPIALGVHATKAAARVGSTTLTAGLGNPVLSVAEDVAAFAAVALAFLAPVAALVFAGLLLAALVRFALRVRRRFRRVPG